MIGELGMEEQFCSDGIGLSEDIFFNYSLLVNLLVVVCISDR